MVSAPAKCDDVAVRRSSFGLIPFLFAFGCSSSDRAFGEADTGAPPDSALADSLDEGGDGAIDTATGDSDSMADASDVADSADAAEAAVPALSIAVAPVTATTVDLTAEGKLAWAHWGLNDATSANYRNGSTLLSVLSGPSWGRYPSYPVSFTWSDGAPTVTCAGTAAGVFHYNSGETFSFTVGPGSTPRTLRVYLDVSGTLGLAKATLSDSSAPSVSTVVPGDGSTPAGHAAFVVSVAYLAKSPTATLNFQFTKSTTSGVASILAATLAAD